LTPTLSPSIKRKLSEREFNDGYLMLSRLQVLLQPTGDTQFMRLTKEYYTLDFSNFKDMSDFLTHIKVLEERIDATNVTLDSNKRTLLCLMMALPDDYRSLAQLWSITPSITADKARDMLLEEERRQGEEEKSISAVKAFRLGKPKPQPKAFKKRCTGCGKDGHTIDECWEENHDIAPDWLKEKRAKKEKEKEEDPPFKTIPKGKKKVVSHVF